MASWRSSSSRRSSSPTSPQSPIPPHSLPQWLRQRRKSTSVIPPGRYKVLVAAFICIALGWFMTSALAPNRQSSLEDVLDISSTDFADESGGYDLEDETALGAQIVKTDLERHDTTKALAESINQDYRPIDPQAPSVKGALSDLHKAVAGKLHGWRPQSTTEAPEVMNGTLTTSKPKAKNVTDTNESISEGLTEHERLGARTRIGKCTILFNGNTYWERAIRTHEAHDRLHIYRLHVLRQHLLDDVWSKPAYILSLLLRELAKPDGERLEWLFWVDADTIILNPYVTIETFLPPADFDDINLLYSEDWNGLNNGVFPVRVSKWAVELFAAIITFRHYRPDGDLTFRDQSAMNTLMKEPRFVKNVMQLPQRWFNAYQGEQNETLAPYQIRRGDFLVHFAGVIDREARMSFWLDRAEQHLDDWEVPLKSTSYIQEVRDFWAEQRVIRQNHKNGLSEARLQATQLADKIDELMLDFSERLSPEQIERIKAAQIGLRTFLADEAAAEDIDRMSVKSKDLAEAASPLLAAKADSSKVLMASAHDAIFSAERDLLSAGFYTGVTSPELNELDDLVKKLKEMILTKEDNWSRANLTSAVDGITAARGRAQEMAAVVSAAAAAAAAAATPPALAVAPAGAVQSQAVEAAHLSDARKMAEQRLKALQSTGKVAVRQEDAQSLDAY